MTKATLRIFTLSLICLNAQHLSGPRGAVPPIVSSTPLPPPIANNTKPYPMPSFGKPGRSALRASAAKRPTQQKRNVHVNPNRSGRIYTPIQSNFVISNPLSPRSLTTNTTSRVNELQQDIDALRNRQQILLQTIDSYSNTLLQVTATLHHEEQLQINSLYGQLRRSNDPEWIAYLTNEIDVLLKKIPHSACRVSAKEYIAQMDAIKLLRQNYTALTKEINFAIQDLMQTQEEQHQQRISSKTR